jgi:hypothetical protein
MFNGARDRAQRAVFFEQRAQRADNREVVALRAARGEDYLISVRADGSGDTLARYIKLGLCRERLLVKSARIAVYLKEASEFCLRAGGNGRRSSRISVYPF